MLGDTSSQLLGREWLVKGQGSSGAEGPVSGEGLQSKHSAHMLAELEQLASDIAALSQLRADMDDSGDARVLEQVIAHLEWTLEELLRCPGMLAETLPWWTKWKARS